jgi:hypothetical protein
MTARGIHASDLPKGYNYKALYEASESDAIAPVYDPERDVPESHTSEKRKRWTLDNI